MLPAINKISAQQSAPTDAVVLAVDRLLQYAASHPTATITYHPSDMRLIVYSDASYLCETQARSRAGGVHFLGSSATDAELHFNGPIDCISTIIKAVVASAAEAEYAAVFINATAAAGLRTTLKDLGYPQSITPIFTDNACAVGLANNTIKLRRSKAMDMRFHWIRDQVKQGHYSVHYKRGDENIADFFTKPLPVNEHLRLRQHFISYPAVITSDAIM